MLSGLTEVPGLGAKGRGVLGALEEPQQRGLTALAETICAPQPVCP